MPTAALPRPPIVPKDANRRTHRNSVLAQLRAMQEVAFADINEDETKPSDRAALMRAYVLLEEQRRILRMRPAPKPIDVSGLQRGSKRGQRQAATPNPVPTDAPGQAGIEPKQP